MRVPLIILVVFLQITVHINCTDEESKDEYVTIWAPSKIFEKRKYNIVILPSDLKQKTEIFLRFHKSRGTVTLESDRVQKVVMNSKEGRVSKKKPNMTMMLYRESKKPGAEPICMTKVLDKISTEKKNFYVFVQTDKPIYKPGDTIKFRVLVVDRDLRPYHINNIHIDIRDPLNRSIREINDLGDEFMGVLSGTLETSTSTELGLWKIHIVVDKRYNWAIVKEFEINKYVLPQFKVYMNLKHRHVLYTSSIQFSLCARYSFGDYVRGNAKLIIRGVGENQNTTYLSTEFKNVKEEFNVTYEVIKDLKINMTSKLVLEAEVTFNEPESDIDEIATTQIFIHNELKRKLKVFHPQKFNANAPFHTNVLVYDWYGDLIAESVESVFTTYDIIKNDGSTETIASHSKIRAGNAMFSILVPQNTTELSITIKFVEAIYRQKIYHGEILIGVSKLIVSHMPKSPRLNNNLKIFVNADSSLDQIIAIVMSRHGSIESHKVGCNFQLHCNFTITVKPDMLPESKVIVYYMLDRNTLLQGETIVQYKDIGRNMLEIKIPESSLSGKEVELNFTTTKNSTVYLLAYDKRLTYLREGNEINKKDVVKELADFDGTNQVTVFHMDKNNWHNCTPEEIIQVNEGKKTITVHSGDSFDLNDDPETIVEDDFKDDDEKQETIEIKENEAKIEEGLRQNFDETWIFDHFDVPEGTIKKKYKALDSITSWKISTFATHPEAGLVIAPTKELIVKNPFFIKVYLPYSIRFEEMLRLDVLVHNYDESKKPVDVKVELVNLDKGKEFNNILYDNCTKKNLPRMSENVYVPYNGIKRVSFFLQPKKSISIEGSIRIRVDATATIDNELKYTDKVMKRLKVENIGIRHYDFKTKHFPLKKLGKKTDAYMYEKQKDSIVYPRMKLEISADYLIDIINIKSNFKKEQYQSPLDMCAILKASVEFLRYKLQRNDSKIDTRGIRKNYQQLLQSVTKKWSYQNTVAFRSYILESMISAIEIGVIPKNIDLISKQLSKLAAFQNNDGEFEQFGNYLGISNELNGKYFETSYAIIPFIKFQKVIDNRFNNVIEKTIKFLTNSSSSLATSFADRSMGAYALALYGQYESPKFLKESANLLEDVEQGQMINGSSKCLKLSQNHTECDLKHTAYTAIAYLSLNNTEKSSNLVHWLLLNHNDNYFKSNTIEYAVATEAIAKYVSTQSFLSTNLTVSVKNEHTFQKTIQMTAGTPTTEIELPLLSSKYFVNITGIGYCSITTIIEKIIEVSNTKSTFNSTIIPRDGSGDNEKIVHVCAQYTALENKDSVLLHVIYEVEMPSGYIYNRYQIQGGKPNIKEVITSRKDTLVQIHFNDFKKDTNYCVDLVAHKKFYVKNLKYSAVTVFDYLQKDNVQTGYYTFAADCA